MSKPKNKSYEQTLVARGVVDATVTGRDEMNLAEFPLALLAQRSRVGMLSFTKERQLTLPDGSQLKQTWIVTGSPEYGLPQPADEDVLLGLLKIAADNGFESPRLSFTQRGLMNLIQWSEQGWHYKRLEQSLERLKTTSIKAKNAFWNNTTKGYQTRHFGIIDSYELFARNGLGTSTQLLALSSNWVRLSTEFFESIQAGYLKPINLALYFSLSSSVSKRLFRYLDKKRYQKKRFEINLQQLASVHLALSESTCRYASWIKKELDRAHKELIERGFLTSASYLPNKDGDWKVCYEFNTASPPSEQLALPVTEDPQSVLVGLLVERGVSLAVARELLSVRSPDFIALQMEVFDHLKRMTSYRPMRNPGGFLAQAIRDGWNLCPPGFRSSRVTEQKRIEQKEHEADRARTHEAIDAIRASLPPATLDALREEAFDQAREQMGPAFRLRKDSRMVEAFLNGILCDRYGASSH